MKLITRVAALVAVATVAASCAFVPLDVANAPVGGDGTPACAALAMRSCGLPYPSDQFTVPDDSTATGLRLALPESSLPRTLTDQLGPGAGAADASADADGFAALTPIYFEMDAAVDPWTLPDDGGDALTVYDVDTGERVPIRAEVPPETFRYGTPNRIVAAWPMERYEYGHTYVARLSDSVRGEHSALLRAPGMRADDPWVQTLRDTLATVEAGPWDRTLSATMFTVRSESNATAQLDAMNEVVRSVDHPVRGLRVDPPLLVPEASAVIAGQVRLTDFRDAHGGARATNPTSDEWADFLLVVPEVPASDAGAPVVIYGHGLTVMKETMLATAHANARNGAATIGIDVPNHGSRQYGQGGYLLDIARADRFGRLASMPLQGIVDHVSLLKAIQDHMGDLDLAPWSVSGDHGDGHVDLDTSRILYEGTSMGGVLGAAFVALAPEVEAALLQVPGTGIGDIIYHSLLWPLFMGVVPTGSSVGDAYSLMGSATMLLDPADNVNVIERIRRNDTPTFLVYGVGDGIVPNFATDRMIGLLDVPVVGDQITEVHVPHQSIAEPGIPASGWGAAQIWPDSAPDTQSFLAHLAFGQPESVALLDEWLSERLAAQN